MYLRTNHLVSNYYFRNTTCEQGYLTPQRRLISVRATSIQPPGGDTRVGKRGRVWHVCDTSNNVRKRYLHPRKSTKSGSSSVASFFFKKENSQILSSISLDALVPPTLNAFLLTGPFSLLFLSFCRPWRLVEKDCLDLSITIYVIFLYRKPPWERKKKRKKKKKKARIDRTRPAATTKTTTRYRETRRLASGRRGI